MLAVSALWHCQDTERPLHAEQATLHQPHCSVAAHGYLNYGNIRQMLELAPSELFSRPLHVSLRRA